MNNVLCIYHGNCADGFASAWVVRKALGGGVEFFAGTYQDPPPDCDGRDVLMVDFSYKRPVIEEMAQTARSIVILDHHKSAAEDLAPFAVELCGSAQFVWRDVPGVLRDMQELGQPPVLAFFDMERSGAGICWDTFFPDQPRPELIDHIEDRDLWRFRLDGTREIQASVFSYPYDFGVWDELFEEGTLRLYREGVAIERKHHKDVAELVAALKRRMNIGGYDVPVANLPYTLTSDAGHLMAQGEPFAACYWDTPDGRVFNLRSTDDGLDVSEIAKQYGGGGHRNAAGFRLPLGEDPWTPQPEQVRYTR